MILLLSKYVAAILVYSYYILANISDSKDAKLFTDYSMQSLEYRRRWTKWFWRILWWYHVIIKFYWSALSNSCSPSIYSCQWMNYYGSFSSIFITNLVLWNKKLTSTFGAEWDETSPGLNTELGMGLKMSCFKIIVR